MYNASVHNGQMNGIVDTVVSAFGKAAQLGTAYYTGAQAVNLAKANANAAKYGNAQSQVSTAANTATQNYMPYLIGAGALVAIALISSGRR